MGNIKTRLAAIERRNRPPQFIEIIIAGGLPDADPCDFARFGEHGAEQIERRSGETESEFRSRARAAAKEAGTAWVTFGGLPA